jgi:cell division ATPase FtsA
VAAITEQLMSEIFGFILEELYRKGVNLEEDIDEIVLIGGGAHLNGIKDFVKSLGFPVRLGIPKNISSIHDKAMDPQFAQAVGVAVYLSQQKELPSSEGLPFGSALEDLFSSKEEDVNLPELVEEEEKPKGFFGRLLAKIKSIFSGD